MRKKSSKHETFERKLAITIAVTAALSLTAVLLAFVAIVIINTDQSATVGRNDMTPKVTPEPEPQSLTTTETSKYNRWCSLRSWRWHPFWNGKRFLSGGGIGQHRFKCQLEGQVLEAMLANHM